MNAGNAILRGEVRAQLFVDTIVRALGKQLLIEIAQYRLQVCAAFRFNFETLPNYK